MFIFDLVCFVMLVIFMVFSTEQENKKSSSKAWMRTVLSSGTLSDKSAALTLLVQDAPVHTLKSLEILIGMCSKKGKREALLSLGKLNYHKTLNNCICSYQLLFQLYKIVITDTLKELFLNDLLLDRKLKPFDQVCFTLLPS